jgi:hypothetical protein
MIKTFSPIGHWSKQKAEREFSGVNCFVWRFEGPREENDWNFCGRVEVIASGDRMSWKTTVLESA